MSFHPRILQLIQHPADLRPKDLSLLRDEKKRYPYAQILHALELRAASEYDTDLYHKIAGLAAAHTADKKSLYAFVNEHRDKNAPDNTSQKISAGSGDSQAEKDASQETIPSISESIHPLPSPTSFAPPSEQSVVSDGEQSVKTEHKVLNQSAPETENTISLGQSNTEKVNLEDNQLDQNQPTNEPEPQPIDSPSEEISSPASMEKELAQADENLAAGSPQVSYHEQTDYKPKVIFKPSEDHIPPPALPEETFKKRETEMERLIREVEEKMREKRELKINSTDTSSTEEVPESLADQLSFNNELPEVEIPIDKNPDINAETQAPVTEQVSHGVQRPPEPSNVPKFMNTWSSWLKLNKDRETQEDRSDSEQVSIPDVAASAVVERAEETEQEKEIDTKDKIIDQFIESNPKISRLNPDLEFSVKEKKSDISHLMTETLAKIYWEQKLYAKAIHGYEILIKKYPENKKRYKKSIEEINLQRQGKQTDEADDEAFSGPFG